MVKRLRRGNEKSVLSGKIAKNKRCYFIKKMSLNGILQRRSPNYANYASLIKLNKLEPSFGGQGGCPLLFQLKIHNIIVHKITVTNIDIFFPDNGEAKF